MWPAVVPTAPAAASVLLNLQGFLFDALDSSNNNGTVNNNATVYLVVSDSSSSNGAPYSMPLPLALTQHLQQQLQQHQLALLALNNTVLVQCDTAIAANSNDTHISCVLPARGLQPLVWSVGGGGVLSNGDALVVVVRGADGAFSQFLPLSFEGRWCFRVLCCRVLRLTCEVVWLWLCAEPIIYNFTLDNSNTTINPLYNSTHAAPAGGTLLTLLGL